MINSIRHIYHTIGFKRFCQLTLSHNKKTPFQEQAICSARWEISILDNIVSHGIENKEECQRGCHK